MKNIKGYSSFLNESRYLSPFNLTDDEIARFNINDLEIRIEDSDVIAKGQMQFVVGAFYMGSPVGMVSYSTYTLDEEPTANIEHVEVFQDLRRRGIATKMYDFIRNQGLKIGTFGNFRTKEGAAFRSAYDKSKVYRP